jgi:hypothetical protein
MARRRPSSLSPAALARRNGIYKGLLGGDRRWLAIGGVFWGARVMKKMLGKNEEFVTLEKLQPGQWMSLRAIPAPTRKERRAARTTRRES